MNHTLWIYAGIATLFFSGALLYASAAFTHGLPPVLVLALIIVAHGVAVRFIAVRSFAESWVSGLVIFGSVALIHLLMLRLFVPAETLVDLSLFGYVWRLGFMLLIGSVVMLLPSYFRKRP